MRKLALCIAGFVALGAIAAIAIAEWPALSGQASERQFLGCVACVPRIHELAVVPRHTVIQIDEVLVLGEVRKKSPARRLAAAPIATEVASCNPSWQNLASGPSDRHFRELCATELGPQAVSSNAEK